MLRLLIEKLRSEKGQGTIEYAGIVIVVTVVLIAVIAMGAANPLLVAIQAAFQYVADTVAGLAPGP